jgi:hypothetical protein
LKKVLLIVSIVILFAILAVILYSNHTETRLKRELALIPITIANFTKAEVKNFELERIIMKSPKELIILVKWDSNSAFISIENWLTHGEVIDIRIFDNKHIIKIY